MKKIILICLLLASSIVEIQAQGITLNEDPIISRMMEVYAQRNRESQSVDGFRIQLLATTDKAKMDEILSNFKLKYPGVFTDWTHNRPFYKIKIGAFSSRANADRYLKSIKSDYPDASIITERVKVTELTN